MTKSTLIKEQAAAKLYEIAILSNRNFEESGLEGRGLLKDVFKFLMLRATRLNTSSRL